MFLKKAKKKNRIYVAFYCYGCHTPFLFFPGSSLAWWPLLRFWSFYILRFAYFSLWFLTQLFDTRHITDAKLMLLVLGIGKEKVSWTLRKQTPSPQSYDNGSRWSRRGWPFCCWPEKIGDSTSPPVDSNSWRQVQCMWIAGVLVFTLPGLLFSLLNDDFIHHRLCYTGTVMLWRTFFGKKMLQGGID